MGRDGQYGGLEETDLITLLQKLRNKPYDRGQIFEIIADNTWNKAGSDDLMICKVFAIIGSKNMHLNPINTLKVGEELKISGTISSPDAEVRIRITGPMEVPERSVQVRDGKFQAIFDTTDLLPGTYTVIAESENAYSTKSFEVMLATPIHSMPTETPTETPLPTTKPGEVMIHLHGVKTEVTVGEDIILALSVVNLITNPTMTVQLVLKVPSGMSITSTEFIQSGAGMYTATYTVEPGKERHIEVHIKTNQVGKFYVEGYICYYFGSDKSTAGNKTVKLDVKVDPPTPKQTPKETPGFELIFVIAGLLAVVYLFRMKKEFI